MNTQATTTTQESKTTSRTETTRIDPVTEAALQLQFTSLLQASTVQTWNPNGGDDEDEEEN
ncbi:MAG TPA: hypothetical protein VFR90_10725 [Methylibium sp.]|uniref:hypothetical protein n=1 Tax=Methylibium sp. TaxID=2067992 RepID=UPI002DBC99D6|nr:hypothetical protein [Methylibium sp.]HEU4459587.1 hypothetical protein [Methylibium sp.]